MSEMKKKKKKLSKHLVNCFGQMSKLGLNSPISVATLSENKKSFWFLNMV